MPQMFPLNWLTLFVFFSLLFILFNIKMYFFYNNFKKNNYNPNLMKLNFIKTKNWMW